VRGDSLDDMSPYLANELQRMPNVTVRLGVEVVDGEGDGRLEAVTLRRRAGDELERLPTSALFAHSGAEPRTGWLEGSVARDRSGMS
jgi:thioredoxin reductase (NADPH)